MTIPAHLSENLFRRNTTEGDSNEENHHTWSSPSSSSLLSLEKKIMETRMLWWKRIRHRNSISSRMLLLPMQMMRHPRHLLPLIPLWYKDEDKDKKRQRQRPAYNHRHYHPVERLEVCTSVNSPVQIQDNGRHNNNNSNGNSSNNNRIQRTVVVRDNPPLCHHRDLLDRGGGAWFLTPSAVEPDDDDVLSKQLTVRHSVQLASPDDLVKLAWRMPPLLHLRFVFQECLASPTKISHQDWRQQNILLREWLCCRDEIVLWGGSSGGNVIPSRFWGERSCVGEEEMEVGIGTWGVGKAIRNVTFCWTEKVLLQSTWPHVRKSFCLLSYCRTLRIIY